MKNLVLLTLLFFATVSSADEIILTPVKDAYICDCLPDTTNPGEGSNFLHQGDFITCITDSLIAWDLSSIPAEAAINDATLRLYAKSFYGAPSGDLTYFPITEDWDENTVTPNNKPGYDGGNKITASYPSVGTWLEADITSFVQDWNDGTIPNYGLFCSSEDASSMSVVAYYSSNYTAPEYRPQLPL